MGRLVNLALRNHEKAMRVNDLYVEVQTVMLDFLSDKPVTDRYENLTIEKFSLIPQRRIIGLDCFYRSVCVVREFSYFNTSQVSFSPGKYAIMVK